MGIADARMDENGYVYGTVPGDPDKPPARIIAEFARERCGQPADTILTIQDEGKYTQEYLSLTHDFYLFA